MSTPLVSFEQREGLAIVTFNNPPRGYLNQAQVGELTSHMDTIEGEDAIANLGSQPFADSEEAVRPVRVEATGASCNDGMLIVAPPSDDDGFTYGTFGGDYHIYDYNFFHMNIRADVSRRIGAFWKR